MKWLGMAAGLALPAFAVDRLLLWMEWRGWIDYRRTNPGRINPGQVGPAFLGMQALFQSGAPITSRRETPSEPSATHRVTAKATRRLCRSFPGVRPA
jgi:hypothetical protein